jgi:hypothetical protein
VLGGPSNFKYLGIKDFSAVITETLNRGLGNHVVAEYLQSTNFSLPITTGSTPFYSAWIAISGVDTPSDVETVKKAMSNLLGTPRLQVTNDTHLLAGPLITQSQYPSCVTVVCGTGSCVVSFRKLPNSGSQLQELARSGGYGWILGDEGSGFHVGRETVRALCTQDDLTHLRDSSGELVANKPKPTYDFRALVLAYFGLPPTARASDIFTELYAPDPNSALASVQVKDSASTVNGHLLLERQQRLSRLAPAVFKAAFPPLAPPSSSDDVFIPDPIAYGVVHTTASELADKIAMLCAPAGNALSNTSKHVLANESLLCLGGSLVKQVAYQSLLTNLLKERGHEFAGVLFVDDCEKAGVEALFAQARGV